MGLLIDGVILYAGVKLGKRSRSREESAELESQPLPENWVKFLDEKYEAFQKAMYKQN